MPRRPARKSPPLGKKKPDSLHTCAFEESSPNSSSFYGLHLSDAGYHGGAYLVVAVPHVQINIFFTSRHQPQTSLVPPSAPTYYTPYDCNAISIFLPSPRPICIRLPHVHQPRRANRHPDRRQLEKDAHSPRAVVARVLGEDRHQRMPGTTRWCVRWVRLLCMNCPRSVADVKLTGGVSD